MRDYAQAKTVDFADISRLVDHDAYRRRLPHLLVHPGAQNVRKVHQELSRGILPDILPAEREGPSRGSRAEAVHELRNERPPGNLRSAMCCLTYRATSLGLGLEAG
jgi:hypothetical protein